MTKLSTAQRRHRAQSRKGALTIAAVLIAFVSMLIAGSLADARTCEASRNPAVCRLALMAGDNAQTAINEGNR